MCTAQSGSPETRWERWQRKQHNQWVRKTNAENYSQRCDFQNKMRVRPSPYILPLPVSHLEYELHQHHGVLLSDAYGDGKCTVWALAESYCSALQ